MREQLLIKIYTHFVQPFEIQKNRPSNPRQRKQGDLILDGTNVHSQLLSVVFRMAKRTSGNSRIGQIKGEEHINNEKISSVLEFLNTHWEIDEKGWFCLKSAEPSLDTDIITYPKFPRDQVNNAVLSTTNEVFIIDTYMAVVQTDNGGDQDLYILNWIEKYSKKVKLLVLDPSGKGIRLRLKGDLNISKIELSSIIVKGLKKLLKWQEQFPDKFEIRLMDEFPAIHGILLTDRLFFGFHFSFTHSQDATFFEVIGNNHVHSDFSKHFNTIWNDNTRSQKLDRTLFNHLERAIKHSSLEIDHLNGTWAVYFHDTYDSVPASNFRLPHQVNIAQYLLSVENQEGALSPRGTLIVPGGKVLRANVLLEQIEGKEYAHLRFTDFADTSFHLSLRCNIRVGQPLFGFYTLISKWGATSGIAVLVNRDNQTLSAETRKVEEWNELNLDLMKTLAFRRDATFNLEQVMSQFEPYVNDKMVFPFKGIYRVLSYGRNDSTEVGTIRGIKFNYLCINEYGYVRYKNLDYETCGRALYVDNNLHIWIENETNKGRRGSMILHTKHNYSKRGMYYAGVFCSLTWKEEVPLAKRIILECLGNDVNFKDLNPELIPLYSPKYNKIDKGIRRLLSGRIKNLVGFFREKGVLFNTHHFEKEWNHSLNLGEVFFDYSCFCWQLSKENPKEKIELALDMLGRAVLHGYEHIDLFIHSVPNDLVDTVKGHQKYKYIMGLLGGKN